MIQSVYILNIDAQRICGRDAGGLFLILSRKQLDTLFIDSTDSEYTSERCKLVHIH